MSTGFCGAFCGDFKEKVKLGVDKFEQIEYYTQADCNSGRHGEVA